jgi:hypothetical protein
MDNTTTFFAYSNMVDFHLKPIIYSLEIMSTEANNHSKPFAYYWHTKSNILKTFSFFAAITNALLLIEYMDFMTNVSNLLKIKFRSFFKKSTFVRILIFKTI